MITEKHDLMEIKLNNHKHIVMIDKLFLILQMHIISNYHYKSSYYIIIILYVYKSHHFDVNEFFLPLLTELEEEPK